MGSNSNLLAILVDLPAEFLFRDMLLLRDLQRRDRRFRLHLVLLDVALCSGHGFHETGLCRTLVLQIC